MRGRAAFDSRGSRRQGLGAASTSGSQVAASFSHGWNSSKAIRDRLSIDQQYALVAIDDLWQIALGHDGVGTVAGQCLNNYPEIRVIRLDAKY